MKKTLALMIGMLVAAGAVAAETCRRPLQSLRVTLETPRAGAKSLTGCASEDTKKVRVSLAARSWEVQPDERGRFEAKLERPLVKGEIVRAAAVAQQPEALKQAASERAFFVQKAAELANAAIQKLEASAQVQDPVRKQALEAHADKLKKTADNLLAEAKEAGTATGAAEQEITLESIDLGRVHAHFELGAILSQQREEFSKSDVYLGFQVVNDWYRRNSQAGTAGAGKLDWRLMSEFDARLTTAPVQGKDGEKINTQKLLESRKSAVMRATLYAPLYSGRTGWRFRDADHQDEERCNALFAAPILKGGLQTISAANRDTNLGNDKVFPFYAFGVRFGHFKFDRSEHEAPELMSYLDVTSELRNSLFKLDPAGRRIYPYRLGVEGRFKIPRLPIQIGADASVGAGLGGDLRFIFALQKFDVPSLARRLKALGGTN